MFMKVIAFTGAQNTGKTTLMYALAERLENTQVGYRLPPGDLSVSRRTKRLGFGINEGSSFETQYHILLSYLTVDLETRKYAQQKNLDYIIYDRSVMDSLPYSKRAVSAEEFVKLYSIAKQHMELYQVDTLIYCDPVPFEDDGERSVDLEFQNEIIQHFQPLKSRADIILPSISVKDRIEMILPNSI